MSLALKNLDRSIKRTVELKQEVHRTEHLDNLGGFLAIEHRERVPEEEGTLKGNIRHKVVNAGRKLLVGTDSQHYYWRFLEKGARRHPIIAKPTRPTRRRKGARALGDEGKDFGPVSSVPHPGIWPPRPFVGPVLANRMAMTEELKKSLRAIDPSKPRMRRRRRRKTQ